MTDFQEVIYIYLNNEIIYDEIYNGEPVNDTTDRATCITAANYHNTDLEKEADSCTHLDKYERKKLYLLLNKYKFIFYGTLGVWNTDPVEILLK